VLYKRNHIERFEAVIQRTVSNILRDTSGRDCLMGQKKVYERIARRLTYCDSNDACEHNIVGPVLASKGVCEGCNALLMVCLRRLGIPCIKVYGKSSRDKAHCWCIVWVNGKPSHCDVTWDIPKDGFVRFNYFNVSDRRIERDHFCFKSSFIPVCS
jgi:transglutaminase/protease-like cytokinesis protein 3